MKKIKINKSDLYRIIISCLKTLLEESKKPKKKVVNDEGEQVPEKCVDCGSKVGVYIQGEPVYKCSKCGKYYGTVPFPG